MALVSLAHEFETKLRQESQTQSLGPTDGFNPFNTDISGP
jgi:hypothetical protein